MAEAKTPSLLDLFGPNPLAASKGPTAYTDAMRANLGLNVQQGGVQPTSGMAGVGAQAGTPNWYNPVAATPDPLMQLLAMFQTPAVPTVPTTAPKPTTSTPAPTDSRGRVSGPMQLTQREYEERRDRH